MEARAHLIFQSTARVYKQLLTSLQSQLFQHHSTSPISTFILGTLPFVIILYQVPGGISELELKLLHRAPHQWTASQISLLYFLMIIWANKLVK